jgi:hypothetical protein
MTHLLQYFPWLHGVLRSVHTVSKGRVGLSWVSVWLGPYRSYQRIYLRRGLSPLSVRLPSKLHFKVLFSCTHPTKGTLLAALKLRPKILFREKHSQENESSYYGAIALDWTTMTSVRFVIVSSWTIWSLMFQLKWIWSTVTTTYSGTS